HPRITAVEHQPVCARVDVPPALVVALEVQAAGCDDAEQALQRAERHRGLARLREAGALATLQSGLVLRRLAVAVERDRRAEAARCFARLEDGGVAVCRACRCDAAS